MIFPWILLILNAEFRRFVSSNRKRSFMKQILDFGMRILDLRYPVYFKMTERHAAQAPALRERFPQIFNLQSSIPACPD